MVKELISRGYQVIVFAREKSGVKGKIPKEQAVKVQPLFFIEKANRAISH